MSNEPEASKELRVLRMVKRVLTDVAKDTNTPPGMRHPLSDSTIMGIRDCLALITAREVELQEDNGNVSTMKPRYPGQSSSNVVVSISSSGKKKNDKSKNEDEDKKKD